MYDDIGEDRAGWHLGNDWNEIVKEVIASCLYAAQNAHQDARLFDEWYISLRNFKSIALFKPADVTEMNEKYAEAEKILYAHTFDISELDLSGDKQLRYKIQTALFSLQDYMIKAAWRNEMIPKRVDLSNVPAAARAKR